MCLGKHENHITMMTKFYEPPVTEVIPIGVLEEVCQSPSGNIPDYNKQSFVWEDEDEED